jgi:ankyrin repeat protein
MVNLLLSKGADPKLEDAEGNSALGWALGKFGAASGPQALQPDFLTPAPDAIIATLLAHGADVNESGPKVAPPLLKAVNMGQTKAVELLLVKGADVNKNFSGITPLHVAAARGLLDIMYLLVDQGAEVNAKDNRGNTPLHYAVFAGHQPQVAWLLDHGANPGIANRDGHTPEGMLLEWGTSGYGHDFWGLPVARPVDSPSPSPGKRLLTEQQRQIVEMLRARGNQPRPEAQPETGTNP